MAGKRTWRSRTVSLRPELEGITNLGTVLVKLEGVTTQGFLVLVTASCWSLTTVPGLVV